MPCPSIYWKQWNCAELYFASLDPTGIYVFATVGACVGPLVGQWLVRITHKGRPDVYGRAGSLEQAKRYAERWARRHWRTAR